MAEGFAKYVPGEVAVKPLCEDGRTFGALDKGRTSEVFGPSQELVCTHESDARDMESRSACLLAAGIFASEGVLFAMLYMMGRDDLTK